MNNFHLSEMYNDIDNIRAEFAEIIGAEADHQAMLEGSVLETRDILRRMEEDSKRAAIIDKRRFIIQTVIGVAALIAAVVAAVAAVIPLLG